MDTFNIKQGNILPKIRRTLTVDGAVLDLTGATVNFRMKSRKFAGVSINRSATIVTAKDGLVEYTWQAGDTDEVGHHDADFRATFSGANLDVPNDSNITIIISPKVL